MGQKVYIVEEEDPIPIYFMEALFLAGYATSYFLASVHFVFCMFIFLIFLGLLMAILDSEIGFLIWMFISGGFWSIQFGRFAWGMTWDWIWTIFAAAFALFLVVGTGYKLREYYRAQPR